MAKVCLEPNRPAYGKVIKAFGSKILDSTGRVDRAELARHVFSDKLKLSLLESIIHPDVHSEVERKKQEYQKENRKFLFYDVPLLFEKNMERSFDLVVMVTCSHENQINRIRSRNQWSETDIERRLSAQLPPSEKETKAHVLIHNDASIEQLEIEARKFLKWLETIS